VGEALEELAEDDLADLASASVLRAARALFAGGGTVTPAAVLEAAASDEERRLLTEVALNGAPTAGVTPLDCVRELKRVPLKARMAEIQRNLGTASGEALEALLREKLEIGRLMAHL
jgi:hypothetical protein